MTDRIYRHAKSDVVVVSFVATTPEVGSCQTIIGGTERTSAGCQRQWSNDE
jgi:hypothetical protein